MHTNTTVRYIAAAISAAVGGLYLLIAGGVLKVVDTAPQAGDAVIPGVAGAAFVILALALALTTNRAIEAFGAAMAIVAIIGYFVVAPHRTPQFEAWGIVIKFMQAALTLVLGYLVLHRSAHDQQRQALN